MYTLRVLDQIVLKARGKSSHIEALSGSLSNLKVKAIEWFTGLYLK